MVYHRILNIFLVMYSRTLLFIHSIYNNLHLLPPNLPLHYSPTPSPLANQFAITNLFSTSVSLFLFCRSIHLCHISDFVYKCYRVLSVSFGLTSLCLIISMSIHVAANGIISFFYMVEKYSILCVCLCVPHLLHPFIHWWTFKNFHVLAIVNSAAVNIGVRVSFWIIVLPEHIPKATHIYYLIVLKVRNLEWVSLVWK